MNSDPTLCAAPIVPIVETESYVANTVGDDIFIEIESSITDTLVETQFYVRDILEIDDVDWGPVHVFNVIELVGTL